MSLLFGPRFPEMYPPTGFKNPVKGRVLCLILACREGPQNVGLTDTLASAFAGCGHASA
jgi:hypothetical protein